VAAGQNEMIFREIYNSPEFKKQMAALTRVVSRKLREEQCRKEGHVYPELIGAGYIICDRCGEYLE